MKKLLIVIAAMSLIACKQTKPSTAIVQNQNFDAYKENFINSLWTIYPNWASSIGFHKNDSLLTIPDDAQRKKEIAFAESQLDSLKLFNIDSLNNQNKTNLNYIKPEKKIFDRSDWPIRKYKIYNEFTKTFDKTTNIEK